MCGIKLQNISWSDYDIGFTIKWNNKMVAENLNACTALKVIFVNVRGEDDEQQQFL